MIESGYYPPGAEFDPRAPYNEFVEKDYTFIVTCDYYDEDDNYILTDDIEVTLQLTADPRQYDDCYIRDMLSLYIDDAYYYPSISSYEMIN